MIFMINLKISLKDLFKSNKGKTKIEIEFINADQKVGLLEIDSTYSINFQDDIKNKILNIDGIEEVISS